MIINIIFAFALDTPKDILIGLITIFSTPDILITDYIHVGGIGAALINSAMVGYYSILLLEFFKCEKTGTNIMSVWLMCGFAFFGKNVLNSTPIIIGGYLYSRYQNVPFSKYIATTFLATTLSPVVSQMWFLAFNPIVGFFIGLLLGIFLGFIVIPVSAQSYKAHGGYNLYNVGFAAGIIAIILSSILKNLGFDTSPVSLWSDGYSNVLTTYIFCICGFLILGSLILSGPYLKTLFKDKTNIIKKYKEINSIVGDSYIKHGEVAYINMALIGIFSTLLILFLGGELNGPLLGGIFTIIGFGCLGKDLFNIAPSMIGCIIAIIINGSWDFSSPGLLLTILFSATLAPISRKFGIFWGIIAGIIHINIVIILGELNGGLNLYNNGFAGGFVAMVLLPIIITLRRNPNDSFINED